MKPEVAVTNFLIQHNLPLATSAHMTKLFKTIFTDSKIAASYSCARTKTGAIINEAFAPHCKDYIIGHCKSHPYSVGTDGSNDTGLKKMNYVTVRLFDIQRSKKVTTHFLDMCVTEGEGGSTAACIFKSIQTKFDEFELPWSMCVSLSVDNTNSMYRVGHGVRNSVASSFLQKNPEIFISGCPCHLAHIAANIAHDGFCKTTGLTKAQRKGKLFEYFEFCNQDYLAVLKHLSVRCLSLERCIERANGKFESLKPYDRFIRLYQKFINPLLKPALIFQQSSIKLFTHFTLLQQRD